MREPREHLVSAPASLAVFATLLALTGLTVVAAYADLGALNTVVALLIAAAKASLVALVFMRLRGSGTLVTIFGLSGLLWLLLMVALVWADISTRGGEPPFPGFGATFPSRAP